MSDKLKAADALKALVGRALANGWNREDANQLDFNACVLGRKALAAYEAAPAEDASDAVKLEAALVNIANSCSIEGFPEDAADTLKWIEKQAREALGDLKKSKEKTP